MTPRPKKPQPAENKSLAGPEENKAADPADQPDAPAQDAPTPDAAPRGGFGFIAPTPAAED